MKSIQESTQWETESSLHWSSLWLPAAGEEFSFSLCPMTRLLCNTNVERKVQCYLPCFSRRSFSSTTASLPVYKHIL